MTHGPATPSTPAIDWLREHACEASGLPLPGRGATLRRWQWLARVARRDLSCVRLAEGHADAIAILSELGREDLLGPSTWGVWAAEPTRLNAHRERDGRWRLTGEKRWCSGSTALDRALVVATAHDGPRLFVIDPDGLDRIEGSWQPFGMEATVSETMCFDISVDAAHAIGGPDAYVARPGFWHGAIGVAACWYGGALGVADRLWHLPGHEADHGDLAARGRVRARLDAVRSLLTVTAAAIDASPERGLREEALAARLLVEETTRAVIDDVSVQAGAGALAFDRRHAQQVADLTIYIRQLHRDRDEQDLGARTDGPGGW